MHNGAQVRTVWVKNEQDARFSTQLKVNQMHVIPHPISATMIRKTEEQIYSS
jgi:hypothetical protein